MTTTKTAARKKPAPQTKGAKEALHELVGASAEVPVSRDPEPDPEPEAAPLPPAPTGPAVSTSYQGMAAVARPARVRCRAEASGELWWVREGLAGEVVQAVAITFADGRNQRTALIYDGDGEGTATFIERGGDGPYRTILGEEV